MSYPRRHGQLVVKCFAQEHKGATDRPGFERTNRASGSSVRLADHPATALPRRPVHLPIVSMKMPAALASFAFLTVSLLFMLE